MAKAKSTVPEDRLALYEALVATRDDVARKGAKSPYTALNGHMFSYLSPTGTLGLRLPNEAREAFLEKYATTLFEQYGAVMKEYVTVPDTLLEDTARLKPYFDLSCEYILSLKPKPTKRRKG